MLDALRNISILNHFLQNVTCSMWAITSQRYGKVNIIMINLIDTVH